MKRLGIIVVTGTLLLAFIVVVRTAFLGEKMPDGSNDLKPVGNLIESLRDVVPGVRSDRSTSSSPTEAVVRSGPGSIEGTQHPSESSTASPPAPQPAATIVLPAELCSGDICNISVSAPPIQVDGSPDCARFTEADSAVPLLFQVPRSLVTGFFPDEGTLHVINDLTLRTPGSEITFHRADITFERYNPGLGGFERLSGRVEFPGALLDQPGFGRMERATMVEIGLDRGQALAHLQVPLCPSRQYLYFQFDRSSGVQSSEQDGSSISYQVSGGSIFLFDPLDPAFQFHIEAPGVGKGGLGRSFNGLIPYTPLTIWGLADKIRPLTAHIYQYALGVQLAERFGIPLEMDGYMALDVDADNNSLFDLGQIGLNPLTGDGFLNAIDELLDRNSDFAVGHSGGLSVGLPLPGDLEVNVLGEELFDFDLGDASTAIYFSDRGSQAYFSGMASPDFVNPLLPFRPVHTLRTAGYISDELRDFELRQEGEFEFRAGVLTKLAPIELKPLRVDGSSLLNFEGTHLHGTALSRIHPDIVFDGQAVFEAAAIAGESERSYMKMSGDLVMAAQGVQGDADLTVDASGLEIAGDLHVDTGRILQAHGVSLGTLLVQGSMRPESGGYRLYGVTSSQIHPFVEAGGQVDVEAFISSDPSRASTSLHGDLIVAGVRLADAHLTANASGVRVEGTHQTPLNTIQLTGNITDAGPNLSGSAGINLPIESPADSVSGLKILGQCVPSAEIRSCTIDNPWPVPDIPGFTHPLIGNICAPSSVGGFDNCSIPVPAARLGDLRGSVKLHLGIDGLGGGLQASFCPVVGSCQSLSGGRLVLGSDPQACVRIPILNREVCVPF